MFCSNILKASSIGSNTGTLTTPLSPPQVEIKKYVPEEYDISNIITRPVSLSRNLVNFYIESRCHSVEDELSANSITELAETATPSDLIAINVGGRTFNLLRDVLLRFPNSRLGKVAAASSISEALMHCDAYIKDTDEYYFDRSYFSFENILSIYGSGSAHPARADCVGAIYGEYVYWQIDDTVITDRCCGFAYLVPGAKLNSPSSGGHSMSPSKTALSHQSGAELTLLQGHSNNTVDKREKQLPRFSRFSVPICTADPPPAAFEGRYCGVVRWKAWTCLENPMSTKAAMLLATLSFLFISATVVLLIMGSMEEFKSIDPKTNHTVTIPVIDYGDYACVSWFTFEYLFRLWASPDITKTFMEPLSLIDLLSIFPFYIEVLFNAFGFRSEALVDFRRSILVMRLLRLLRLLRVIRVLKFARYSSGFQTMALTLRRSYKELLLLTLFMATANVVFSTVMYHLEREQPGTLFTSIPAACWWCMITMTTVGYGDIYPKSVLGKLFGSFVSLAGVILLAFPISIIVDNFNTEYREDEDDALRQDTLVPSPVPSHPVPTFHLDQRHGTDMACHLDKERGNEKENGNIPRAGFEEPSPHTISVKKEQLAVPSAKGKTEHRKAHHSIATLRGI